METKKITAEMYAELKKELPAEAVTKHPTKTYLSSIKAIYVTERLNDVFGCGSWQIRAEKVSENDKGMVVIKTTLTIPEYGVYYESFGGNDNGGDTNKNFDLGDAYKGATTDGITKIGSYLGIGITVFKGKHKVEQTENPKFENEPKKETIWLTSEQFDKAIKSNIKGIEATLSAYSKPGYGMKADYRTKLVSQYSKLLDETGATELDLY